MPPKDYKCSVCGETVSKRKSNAMPDGTRACKIHEETQEALQAKKDREAYEKEMTRKRKEHEERARQRWIKPDMEHERDMLMRCWHCGSKGIRAQDFFAKIAVEVEKMRLTGQDFVKAMLTDPREITKHFDPRDRNPLFAVENDDAIRRVRGRYHEIAGLVGYALCCNKCIEQRNYEHPANKQKQTPMNLQKMALLGSVVQPALEAEAMKELTPACSICGKHHRKEKTEDYLESGGELRCVSHPGAEDWYLENLIQHEELKGQTS